MPRATLEPGVSLHFHLSVALRRALQAGRYRPGDLIPTEEALMREFSVSRGTVRRALLTLQQEGWVERRQGHGTRVTTHPPHRPLTTESRLQASGTTLEGTTLHVLSFRRVAGETPEQEQLQVERIRRRGDEVLWLTKATLPGSIGALFTETDFAERTVIELLTRAGRLVVRTREDIGAVLADSDAAAVLQVKPGTALIDYHRDLFGVGGEVLCTHCNLIPPERYRITLDLLAGTNEGFNDEESLDGGDYWRGDPLPVMLAGYGQR